MLEARANNFLLINFARMKNASTQTDLSCTLFEWVYHIDTPQLALSRATSTPLDVPPAPKKARV